MAKASNKTKKRTTEEIEDAWFKKQLDIIYEYYNNKTPAGFLN